MASESLPLDQETADAFSTSWNTLPSGSVYTADQFEDWMEPMSRVDFEGKRVLEMGCGNGSLLVHSAGWSPALLQGIDLGDSIRSATENMEKSGFQGWRIDQADLTTYRSDGFDAVYCIGVLHHLKNPFLGLQSVIANVTRGGRFHCWVYAREGNLVVRMFVEPMRRLFSKSPWWFTKYAVATPLSIPVYLYAKTLSALKFLPLIRKLPLAEYCFWIAKREIAFFRHVIFDQLVTPQTCYLSKEEIGEWLTRFPEIEEKSVYLILRNGNSWKFGGRLRE